MCGDAHCCSFTRYKANFKLIAQHHFQELPLLPGEFEFLEKRGWLTQFGDFDHKVTDYPIDGRSLRIESIVSRRPNCACDHDTRPVVCRLYPLLPVFNDAGWLTGADSFGIYEELEKIGEMAPACPLSSLPFDELQKFLLIASEIASRPSLLYYITVYRLTKSHVASRLKSAYISKGGSPFSVFEGMLLRGRAIDHTALKLQLCSLADRFAARYGNQFSL